jgi:hypothetical protein
MRFKLHKDKTVTSTLGHTVEFKKGELVHVPKEMWNEAVAVGAIPENELPDEETKKADQVLSADERKKLVFTAFTKLVEKNERESFTGNGAPHNKAVAETTGFPIDAKERDRLWAEFRQLNASPDA